MSILAPTNQIFTPLLLAPLCVTKSPAGFVAKKEVLMFSSSARYHHRYYLTAELLPSSVRRNSVALWPQNSVVKSRKKSQSKDNAQRWREMEEGSFVDEMEIR